MKKTKKTQKHGPSWVLALVAILAPVLAAGAMPLFAAEQIDAPQKLFDFSLFNGQEFLRSRRERHAAAPDITVPDSEDTNAPATTVNPCDPVPAASSSESSVEPLTVDDLTYGEREALRGQLRNRACPQNAEPAYLALCQRLVKEMPVQETRTGLTNPNQ